MNKAGGIFKAAWIIALVTIVSKLIGFIRDVVIAKYYGAGLVSDAYFYAYQIPAIAMLILGGVGGPFHSATVAVFSQIIPSFKEKPTENAVKLYRVFITLSFVIFLVLAVLAFMFSDVIMHLIINGGSPELVSLASHHLKIMSPILILGGIIGIYYGLLVTYDRFLLPNLSPVVMSLVIILALVLSKHDHTGYILAAATVVGALCQLVIQVPAVRNLGYKFVPSFDIAGNPALKDLSELLFPAILSSAIGQIHIYIDMFFASQLQTGVWTAIGYANRVYQFPLGVLVTAFLVPLFPLFSKLVAANNLSEVKYYFNRGIGMLNFLAIPIIIIIALCGYEGVQLIFQRGAFDANATALVSEALFFLSIGLIPYVFRDSITRVFYSFNDSKTPFIVALLSIFVKVALNYLFITVLHYGIGGITFSTTLVTLLNATLLGTLIRRKLDMDYKPYFMNILKMLIAGALAYTVLFPLNKFWLAAGTFALFIKLAAMVLLCFGLYFVFSLLLKNVYAKILVQKLGIRNFK